MSWQRVRVQVGYQRYRYRVKMFCDVCGKQINWCVPPKDITSTEHVCEYCYRKMEKKLVTPIKGELNKLSDAKSVEGETR